MLSIVVLFVVLGSASAQDSSYPPDPFGDVYALPEHREVGTAAGQLRGIGLLGPAYRRAAGIDIQATVEKVAATFMGVRFSSALSLWSDGDEAPSVWSLTVGPAFHFLPYRVVDLGMFLEGGVAWVDPFDGVGAPVLTPGATLDIALGPVWFVHLEGQVVWVVYDDAGEVQRAPWYRGLVGLGFGL